MASMNDARSPGTVLRDSLGFAYPAERFGDARNDGVTAVVTASRLAVLLLTVINDPDSSYVAFAIDEAGTCTLQDLHGHLDTLKPADDGGYDLGGLGWTFLAPANLAGRDHGASSI